MKRVALLVVMCALSQTALAQTPDCKSIAAAAARLACYDKVAAPAPASATRPAPRPAASTSDTKYVDSISAEDALMNARLKNICRGC